MYARLPYIQNYNEKTETVNLIILCCAVENLKGLADYKTSPF